MRVIFSFLLAILSSAGLCQPASDAKELLTQLSQPATTVHAAAALVTMTPSRPDVTNTITQELPGMLLATKEFVVVRSEAKVAGDLRVKTAIPALVRLLDEQNEGGGLMTFTRNAELRSDPVARALYEIGAPARPALRQALESGMQHTRVRVIRILLLMKTSASNDLLVAHLSREQDPQCRGLILSSGIIPGQQ